MSEESKEAQDDFMRKGGIYALALRKMRKEGAIPEVYTFAEYPKALNLSLGVREIDGSTEDVKGRTQTWTTRREVFAHCVVQDAAEEDATRAAFDRTEDLGIEVGEHWTANQIRDVVALADRAHKAKTAPRPDPEKVKAARVAALKAELAALEPAADAEAMSLPANPLSAPPAATKRRGAPAVADLPVVAPEPVA